MNPPLTVTKKLAKLTQLSDPLVSLAALVNFEAFRPKLATAFHRADKKPCGRKPYDVVLMFKILMLQRLYNLSDEAVEFQINDRLSFQRFLGLSLMSDVPDYSTVWHFRESLTEADIIRDLFEGYAQTLRDKGILTLSGTIVDASFVPVPIQHNSKEERTTIKEGNVPEPWIEQPRMLCQKDTDARWTKKERAWVFGYKNHIKADVASLLVTGYRVTPANVNDCEVFLDLLDPSDTPLFADKAYRSIAGDKVLQQLGIENWLQEKGHKCKALTGLQHWLNRWRSRVRCRIEHIFGCVQTTLRGPELRYIGLRRITAAVGLSNLAYNMVRYGQLVRSQFLPAVPTGI
jgi:IS5 family transposase